MSVRSCLPVVPSFVPPAPPGTISAAPPINQGGGHQTCTCREAWEAGEWGVTWFCWDRTAALYGYRASWMLNATTDGLPPDDASDMGAHGQDRKDAKEKRRKGGKHR